MNLKNKVAVITGASSGIGKAIAQALLKEDVRTAGWQRSQADLNHADYLDVTCDVSDASAVQRALQQTIDKFKTIDILINNAGLGYFGKMHDMAPEQWHRMFDVNVHGVFNCVQAVAPVMIENNGGHIINVSSIAGKQAVVDGAGYSATKFAVSAISQSLYRELRPHNIKVSVLYPGSTDTHFFDNIQHTLRRQDMIRPEDVAASVVHLLSTPADYLPFEMEVRTMHAR